MVRHSSPSRVVSVTGQLLMEADKSLGSAYHRHHPERAVGKWSPVRVAVETVGADNGAQHAEYRMDFLFPGWVSGFKVWPSEEVF